MSSVKSCTQPVFTLVLFIVSASALPGADEKSSKLPAAMPLLGEMTMLIHLPVAKDIGLTEQQSETIMRLLQDHYTQLEEFQFRYPRGAQDVEGGRFRQSIMEKAVKAATTLQEQQEQLRKQLSDDQMKKLADVTFPKPSQMPQFKYHEVRFAIDWLQKEEHRRKEQRPQWGKPLGRFADGKSELQWYGSQCRLVREEQDIGWLCHPPEFLITRIVISPNGKHVLTVGNLLPKGVGAGTHSVADLRIWEASSGKLIDVIQTRDKVDLVHFAEDAVIEGHSEPWNGK